MWISLSLSPISVRFGADFCMAEMAFANFQLHLFARKALDVDGFPILLSVFFFPKIFASERFDICYTKMLQFRWFLKFYDEIIFLEKKTFSKPRRVLQGTSMLTA